VRATRQTERCTTGAWRIRSVLPMPQSRRKAHNEAVFRDVNEHIAALGAAHRRRQLEIVCECANLGCSQPISLSLADYEEARRDPRTFVLAPGHNDPQLEIVLADRRTYLLVQKTGDAAAEAVMTDPR
jgi:hypothetical protein